MNIRSEHLGYGNISPQDCPKRIWIEGRLLKFLYIFLPGIMTTASILLEQHLLSECNLHIWVLLGIMQFTIILLIARGIWHKKNIGMFFLWAPVLSFITLWFTITGAEKIFPIYGGPCHAGSVMMPIGAALVGLIFTMGFGLGNRATRNSEQVEKKELPTGKNISH